MTEPYDSAPDTWKHIDQVRDYVNQITNIMRDGANVLEARGLVHDVSKLSGIEKEAFDRGTPRLWGITYGSDEYREAFAKYGMKEGVSLHYANNSHHPEHWQDGIRGMSLFDVLEMLADWAGAVKRHADGDLAKSIEINEKRFGLGEPLTSIIRNTYIELGLLSDPPPAPAGGTPS